MESEIKREVKVKVGERVLRLRRLHPKLGEIITWEVLNEDATLRIGVVRKLNDQWNSKKIGWQLFRVTYWLGTKYWPQAVVAGPTRKEVLNKLIAIKKEYIKPKKCPECSKSMEKVPPVDQADHKWEWYCDSCDYAEIAEVQEK